MCGPTGNVVTVWNMWQQLATVGYNKVLSAHLLQVDPDKMVVTNMSET